MEFTVNYRSTKPLPDAVAGAIVDSAKALCERHDWVNCEPVKFLSYDGSKHLQGHSGLSFSAPADESVSTEPNEANHGTLLALLDVLCELSQQHDVDWEIYWGSEDEPIGGINDGVAEPQLLEMAYSIAGFSDVFGWVDADPVSSFQPNSSVNKDDRDDGPQILKFPTA